MGRLTKSFIPDPFYNDFAVTVTAKPTTRRGGVLFAITDAYQKVGKYFDSSCVFSCFSIDFFFFFLLIKKVRLCFFSPSFLFKIVHLGVALSEVEDGSQRVMLYYTDPGTRGGTREAASFKMGDLTGRWARFTLTVQGAEVGGMCSLCLGNDMSGTSTPINHDHIFFFFYDRDPWDLPISALHLKLGDNYVNCHETFCCSIEAQA